MIKLSDGRWCYSPALPEAYTMNGLGPGDWAQGDLARWNIAWLTFAPFLESYREGKISIQYLIQSVVPEHFGIVAATARHEMADIFPGLRSALTGPLPLFIHTFRSGPSHMLPAYEVIPEWTSRVLAQAEETFRLKCDLEDTLPKVSRAEIAVVDNVVRVNFRKSS